MTTLTGYRYDCPRCRGEDPHTNCAICQGQGSVVVTDKDRVFTRRGRAGASFRFELPPAPEYVFNGWNCTYHKGLCINPLDCDYVPSWRLKAREIKETPAPPEKNVDVDGYIAEIAELRIDFCRLQDEHREVVSRLSYKTLEVKDLEAEIARHHKDFIRISKLAEEADAFSDINPERIKLIRTIRNIVG